MEQPNNTRQPWLKLLRPLLWWFVLVLVLFGIRTHQRLREQTRLTFSVSMQGRSIDYEASARLNGKPFMSGEQLPIGTHTFSVSHPKGISFSTNFFAVYGKRNFGKVDLKRAQGTLDIQAQPAASLIVIRGPELELRLTNSAGTNISVPTDPYFITAKYKYWGATNETFVAESTTKAIRFTPRMGRLQIACNKSDASFELRNQSGRTVELGGLPMTISDLPEGNYKLAVIHHGNRKKQNVEVRHEATNDLNIEFIYGGIVLETVPAGAMVWEGSEKVMGKTPLNLLELEPGERNYVLRMDGYEPVDATFSVIANETILFKTNLMSTSYIGAISVARRFIASGNYSRALEAATEALRIQPGDSVATSLKRRAVGMENFLAAQELGNQGNYIAGIERLSVALEALPDDEEIKRLLAEFEKRKPEQLERMRVERLARPKKTFEEILATVPNSELFESYEFKSSKPYHEIESAIYAAFQTNTNKPAFKLVRHPSPKPETFYIEAVQELSTYLATSAGRRQCVIVGGQAKDDETQIFFKIVEYKTEAQIKFSIGNLIGTPVAVNYLPIHPSRGALTEKYQTRLTEGISNVTAIVQAAFTP